MVAMLDGVMPIVVTTFAVLGIYFLWDMLARALAGRREPINAVVVWAPAGQDAAWGTVLDLRSRLPDARIVVLTPGPTAMERLEPGMKDVCFATPDTLAQAVCRQLHVPMEES